MDIKEIIESWITASSPNEDDIKIADLRLKICEHCPAYKPLLNFYICSECNCPIHKKIFSKNKTSCPKKIWPF